MGIFNDKHNGIVSLTSKSKQKKVSWKRRRWWITRACLLFMRVVKYLARLETTWHTNLQFNQGDIVNFCFRFARPENVVDEGIYPVRSKSNFPPAI